MSTTTNSEMALAGSLAQWPGEVLPICERLGITESSFNEIVCRTVYTTVKRLATTEKVVTFDMVLTEMGDDYPTVSEYMNLCPSASLAEYYAGKVREDERRRNLFETVRDVGERLSKGGAVDVLAEQLKAAGEAVAVKADEKPDPLAGRKSLAELATMEIDHEQTLLGNRFLCRRGAMLYVGRSGLGKSSSSAQQDVLWPLGRDAFGIHPARPLNILCIQAENDEGDLQEMGAGVLSGLNLTDAEIEQVNRKTTYVQWFENGGAFLAKLRAALTAERDAGRPFDLVRIDPLLSFAGGDLVNPSVVASFCRTGLNSIAFDFDCGIIAVHHTPKINLTARPRMDGPEWIYAATGCADLSNWARAILVIADSPNPMPGTFRLIGAKRGKRIEWRDTDGELEFERYYSHAENRGGMFWREATPEEIEVATAKAEKDKKPTALQEIAGKDATTMKAHAMKILQKGPMAAADFIAGVMREFQINEKFAKTVAKWLTDGDGKPVKVRTIGKVHWHGTAEQLDALQNPPIKGLK